MGKLGPSAPPAWLWRPYVARGCTSLLIGKPKAGKSTLLAHLLRDLFAGGGLAGDDAPARPRVLIVSEEAAGHWVNRRDALGLDPAEILVQTKPFRGKPSLVDWLGFVGDVANFCAAEGVGLAIVDTLANVWPVVDENDASAVMAAVLPLSRITDTGAGLLLAHHPRKSDATEGMASRGTSALPGAVDCILEFHRDDTSGASTPRRILRAFSRWDETPAELLIELGEDGYRMLGDRGRFAKDERLKVVRSVLAGAPEGGWTPEEVQFQWPSEPRPSIRAIELDLGEAVSRGWITREGTGRKGSPFRFAQALSFRSANRIPSPKAGDA